MHTNTYTTLKEESSQYSLVLLLGQWVYTPSILPAESILFIISKLMIVKYVTNIRFHRATVGFW